MYPVLPSLHFLVLWQWGRDSFPTSLRNQALQNLGVPVFCGGYSPPIYWCLLSSSISFFHTHLLFPAFPSFFSLPFSIHPPPHTPFISKYLFFSQIPLILSVVTAPQIPTSTPTAAFIYLSVGSPFHLSPPSPCLLSFLFAAPVAATGNHPSLWSHLCSCTAPLFTALPAVSRSWLELHSLVLLASTSRGLLLCRSYRCSLRSADA